MCPIQRVGSGATLGVNVDPCVQSGSGRSGQDDRSAYGVSGMLPPRPRSWCVAPVAGVRSELLAKGAEGGKASWLPAECRSTRRGFNQEQSWESLPGPSVEPLLIVPDGSRRYAEAQRSG